MKQADKPEIRYRGRQIGAVREERLNDRAKLRGAVKQQAQEIVSLSGEVEKLRHVIVVQAEHLKAAIRAVNWQRVFAEIGYAATLMCVRKYANQLYSDIESAHVAEPSPPRIRDVSDSGLVVF